MCSLRLCRLRILILATLSLLVCSAFGQAAEEIEQWLIEAKTISSPEDFQRVMESAPDSLIVDSDWEDYVTTEADFGGWEAGKEILVATASASLAADQPPQAGLTENPKESAQEILRRPEFRDTGPNKESNWLGLKIQQLADKIAAWLDDLFKDKELNPEAPDFSLFNLASGLVKGVIWILIGLLAAGLIFVIFKIRWNRTAKKRGGGGLLDDDEPDRSADEWLNQADMLAAKGEHRMAVRCLYLATLMRLDEAGVAEFRRWETNWEHLRRIQSSPRRPEDLDVSPLTRHFDLIWYGRICKGEMDVAEFREAYLRVVKLLASQGESAA